jgi:hypothetical protein
MATSLLVLLEGYRCMPSKQRVKLPQYDNAIQRKDSDMQGRWKKRQKSKLPAVIVITGLMLLAFAFILFAIISTYSTAPGAGQGQKGGPLPNGQVAISGLGR